MTLNVYALTYFFVVKNIWTWFNLSYLLDFCSHGVTIVYSNLKLGIQPSSNVRSFFIASSSNLFKLLHLHNETKKLVEPIYYVLSYAKSYVWGNRILSYNSVYCRSIRYSYNTFYIPYFVFICFIRISNLVRDEDLWASFNITSARIEIRRWKVALPL